MVLAGNCIEAFIIINANGGIASARKSLHVDAVLVNKMDGLLVVSEILKLALDELRESGAT